MTSWYRIVSGARTTILQSIVAYMFIHLSSVVFCCRLQCPPCMVTSANCHLFSSHFLQCEWHAVFTVAWICHTSTQKISQHNRNFSQHNNIFHNTTETFTTQQEFFTTQQFPHRSQYITRYSSWLHRKNNNNKNDNATHNGSQQIKHRINMFGLKSVPVIQLPLCCGLWENCCVVENSCCVVKVLCCVEINLCCVVRFLCGVLCCGKCCCVVKNSCCVVRFSVWRCGRFMPPYSL